MDHDLNVDFSVPDLYGDTGDIPSPASSPSPSSISSSSGTCDTGSSESSSPEPDVKFTVELSTVFWKQELHSYLLNVWGTKPAEHYLSKINRSKLRGSNRSVWTLAQEKYVRGQVAKYRAEFILSLEEAKTDNALQRACTSLSEKLDGLIESLKTYAKSATMGDRALPGDRTPC